MTSIAEDEQKLEPSYTAEQPFWTITSSSLHSYTMDNINIGSHNSTLGISKKNEKTCSGSDLYLGMFGVGWGGDDRG